MNFFYFETNSKPKIFLTNKNHEMCEFLLNRNKEEECMGFFSGALKENNKYYFWRDPIGLSKLYIAISKNSIIDYSNSWIKLAKKGHKLENIFSVPKGLMLKYEENKFNIIRKFKLPKFTKRREEIKFELNRRINLFFNELIKYIKTQEDKSEIFLALSGGLDSSILMANASRTSLKFHPVTLSLPGSEDSKIAANISKILRRDHFLFKVNHDEVLSHLMKSPTLCDDWRDFNVHCSTLNSLLGEKINKIEDFKKSTKKYIITGDLMNEYVCDYKEEVVDGKEYYKLPKVSKKNLQKYLINGLSTSSREDLVFSYYGIGVIQPYAIATDLFISLTEGDLSEKDLKNNINLLPQDSFLLKNISKSKLRAQVGSKENMGILSLSIRNKIDDDYFLDLISKEININIEEIKKIIFAGNFKCLEVI